MFEFISLSLFAYLLGSIPFAFLIGRAKGIDIRKLGSKSTTDTNLARALGWRYGILALALDVSKGVISAYLAKKYLISIWQIIFVSLFPTLGHDFPIWLKFKYGGRGASTFFGATLVLVGPKFFFSIFSIWFLIFFLTKTISLANLIFPWVLTWFLYKFFPPPYFMFGIVGAFLMTLALRNNIKRLVNGTELKTPLKF